MNDPLAPMRDQETIRTKEDLLLLFSDAAQATPAGMRVGPEMEKFGVVQEGKPLPFEGGVTQVLDSLEGYGWLPDREKAGGPRIALKRNDASVTLEPGGQLELSGAPAGDVHAIVREMDEHLSEIASVSKELGIHWLGVGFHPFAKLEDFSWVPKARYTVMREYLPTRGRYGLDMMHRTCTVQGNYDFTSLEDAMRKVRLGLKLSPLVAAMFANSPWLEGVPHGGVSMRSKVWLDVDPDRSGLLPSLWHEGATALDYVEWALDVPMFLFKRDHVAVMNTGQTFRSFWKSGYAGHVATQADWQLHVNTLFPEVRLKRTIEIRSADSQGRAIAPAVPGLFAGLYYDAEALERAEELVRDWTYDEVLELRTRVWKEGLRAEFKGRRLASQAEAVFEIARSGLVKRARLDERGQDESVHLAALGRLIEKGMTPADELLEKTRGSGDVTSAIIEATAL